VLLGRSVGMRRKETIGRINTLCHFSFRSAAWISLSLFSALSLPLHLSRVETEGNVTWVLVTEETTRLSVSL